MKYLKKFLALGMCAGILSTSSCSAVLPDEVMSFYLSTGIDEVILETPEGLRAICYFLNGGYGPMLIGQTALENYLSQVYYQKKMNGDLDSLRNRFATHLEDIRKEASVSFKCTVGYGKAKSAVSSNTTSPEPSQDDFSPFVVVGNIRRRSYFYPFKTVTVPLLAISPTKCERCDLHKHTGGIEK